MLSSLIFALVTSTATTTEVEIAGAGGFKISAIIEMPESAAKPCPAVILMPGSGPTNRDGNQPPAIVTDILKDVAAEIRKEGFATIRFDKRPVAKNRSQWPTSDPAKLRNFFSFENHVLDAVEVFKFVQKYDGIDGKKIVVLGHSEGGMLTAEMTKLVTPAGLILMGTPARPMATILHVQIKQSLEANKVPEETKTKMLNDVDRGTKAVIEDQPIPKDMSPQIAVLFPDVNLDYWKGMLAFDAPKRLEKYQGPVLVLNGEGDIQISATLDAPLLMKALDSRKNGHQKLVIVSGASHNFKKPKDDKDPGFTGPVVPVTTQAIREWLKSEFR